MYKVKQYSYRNNIRSLVCIKKLRLYQVQSTLMIFFQKIQSNNIKKLHLYQVQSTLTIFFRKIQSNNIKKLRLYQVQSTLTIFFQKIQSNNIKKSCLYEKVAFVSSTKCSNILYEYTSKKTLLYTNVQSKAILYKSSVCTKYKVHYRVQSSPINPETVQSVLKMSTKYTCMSASILRE